MINFSRESHLQKDNRVYILPLIDFMLDYNIIPKAIYFHCISGVRDATIGILSPSKKNKVITVRCRSNVLIFHSTEEFVKVIKAIRSDRDEWEYIESKAYRHVETMEEDPPFVKETNQTRIRNQIVEDVIQYNIPVVIEGVTSSGKTFTVEQYCRRSLIPFVRYNFSFSSTTEELLGDLVITNDEAEKIKFQDGAFTDAFIHGKLLLMDEMSLAPPSVVQSVLSYLSGKKILHEGKDGSEERVMHRDFRIIATQKPAGSSYKRSNLSSAIRDCFRFITHYSTKQKYFPMIEKEERLEIITAMFGGNAKIGRKVCEVHDRADNRKNVSGREIDKGKDYTLRDCSRTKWMMEILMNNKKMSESEALDRALQIAYNEDLKTNPVFKADITFGKAALDKECWKDVYDRVRLGLESGCHVLLIGETEYVSRKYCQAIMEIMEIMEIKEREGTSCEVIHCSSTSSTESVIGSYSLEKDDEGKPVPRFCPSPLLTAIENGGICVLQSMHLMKSNVIERLNSVLELSPADGHHHVVRFDERRERPEFEMSPKFRVIATTSEKGLLAFSPALRNRFLEVFVSHEDVKRFENSPKLDNIEEDEIDELIHEYSPKLDWFKQQELHRMACFARKVCGYELDVSLMDMLAKQQPIPELQSLRSHCTEASRLFYCICKNKAVALCGPRGSGKSFAIHEIINKLYIRIYQVFSVSGETEFSTLMGNMDMNGNFRVGRLLQAVESGGLVIFENAENMSAELLEMLDTVCDPFTDKFTDPASTKHKIHPAFRALFVFTTRRVNSLPSLPAYFDICEMSPIKSDEAKELMNSEICKRLCDHIDSGEIPLNEVFTLDKICFDIDYPILIVAALFADRMDRKELLERVIEEWEKSADDELKKELDIADAFVETSLITVSISPNDNSHSILQRGPVDIEVPINYLRLCSVDSSVLTALFTLSISNFKQTHLPVLLVGDSDIASEVTRLLLPNAVHMEMSRSMEMSHTFGEISVCRKEDIQYILRQTLIENVDGTPMEAYREQLNEILHDLEDEKSVLVMRPGPILRSIMSNNSIVLNNINLLNDRLLPRLYSLLFSLDSQEFSLFEDYSQIESEILGESVNAIVTCEDPDYGRVAKKDQFIQVFCQPYSDLGKAEYEFENRDDYPLHILRKSNMLKNEFVNAEKVIPFYLRFLQSDLASRENLIQMGIMNENLKEVSEFLQSSNEDNAMIEDLKRSLSFLFTNDVINSLYLSLQSKHPLLPTKTTIQLLASIVLADRSHLPLILEGDPGVGKTVSAENYFEKENLAYKRINFSNTITIDSLFGCYTIVNGSLQFRDGSITELLKRGDHSDQRIALLLDEVNLAPSDVLEVLLTLIRCYVNHDPFQVPGGDLINIPSDMLIICCMNPASMSANRSTLPRQFYKYCIYHRDLKYTLNELLFCALQMTKNITEISNESTENQILDLFEYSYNSYQKTSIPFSLRDVLKVDQIVNNGSNLSLETALWMVFACRYEESERKEIEKILKLEDTLKVDIVKQDDQCVVRGYWDIETQQMYSESFREYCFTSTEKVTIFKLSLALQSKRAILVYGSSPSGKSYCISNLALMWDKQCTSVFLNHESSPDVFIGRSTLGIDDNGNECIKFREGPLLKAMESGDWIVIEDIHLANNDVMESLNSLCEENPTLKVLAGNKEVTYSMRPKKGERRIHEAFRIFFTISDNTLKHFTGPFLSRCVIVYCDPISTQANVQEICQINESTHSPCNFGPKESKTFRRCIRVINSEERDAFLYEFGYQPKENSVISKIEIPKSIVYELSDLCNHIPELSEADRMNRMIAIMEKICSSTKSAFGNSNIAEFLERCKRYFGKHFIYYVMDCAIKVLEMRDIQNCMMKRQEGENAGVLRRWYLIPNIDPKMKGKYRMSDWMFNKRIPLHDKFDIPTTEQYKYLELLFITDRRNELMDYMQEDVLNDLALEVFGLLDNSDRSDLTEQMMKAIVNIREIYLDVRYREQLLRDMSKQKDYESLHTQIESVKQSVECFPSEIKESKTLKELVNSLESIELAARLSVMEQIDEDGDDEQSMKFRYSEALLNSGKNEEMKGFIMQAFEDKMIDSKTFKSMNFNVIEPNYSVYAYFTYANRSAAKLSHFIYKLQTFKNYPFILSEYADVLKEFELNVADILREFKSSSILLPYLLTMLNVLLKKEMEDFDWNQFLVDYSEYPFVTPVEVSQNEFAAAIEMLFTNNWYKTYWISVQSRMKDRHKACKSLRKHLLEKCFSSNAPITINLRVPLILNAVDTNTGVDNFSCMELSVVESEWKCDLPSHVEPGTTIPSDLLEKERLLSFPVNISSSVFLQVWDYDCKLRLEDKLLILCPRKRTLLGRVVLDMLNVTLLRNAFMKVIRNVSSIDELVVSVISTAADIHSAEEEKLQIELETTERKINDSELEFQQRDAELKEKMQELIDKYSKLAEERTRSKGLGKDFKIHNSNTIKMFCYMYAVNNLKEQEFNTYLDNAKSQERDIDYVPCYDYHPFDFQMVFIRKNHALLNENKQISVMLSAPEGIQSYLKSDVIQLNGNAIKKVGVSLAAGYLLVLPLAPFKWHVNITIDEENIELKRDEIDLVYWSNGLNKLSYYKKRKWNAVQKQNSTEINTDMYILLCLLKCMVYIRDRFGLKYAIPVAQDNLLKWKHDERKQSIDHHPSFVYVSSNLPFSFGLFASTNSSSKSSEPIECTEIQCAEDIVPPNIVTLDQAVINSTKTYWTLEDFLSIGPDFGSVKSVDPVAEKDVKEFQMQYNEYKRSEQRKEMIKRNEKEYRDNLKKIKREYFSPSLFFFPMKMDLTPLNTNELLSVDSIIVVYDGTTASICLPKNNTFILPISYVGIHGNQIVLHYLLTSLDVSLELVGNDCYISKRPNSFEIVMKDATTGMKKVKLTAIVYRLSDSKKLASKEVICCYERRAIPYLINTSVPCAVNNTFSVMHGNRFTLYPKSSPVSIDLFVNGNASHYNCAQGSTNVISTNPFIDVSFIIGSSLKNYSYSNCFTCNEKGIAPFKVDPTPPNYVELPNRSPESIRTSIVKLHSVQSSEFLSTFSSLPITIISATLKDRNSILPVLSGCVNDMILPSIKDAAERVLELVPQENIKLEWNNEILAVNRTAGVIMNENGYRKLNSKSCLSIMNQLSMNNLFEVLYSRRTIAKIVEPMSKGDSLTRKTLTSTTKQISSEVVQAIVDTSVKAIEMFKEMKCMSKQTHSTISVIIDTNCSLRKKKLRMRTIITCVLVTVMRELGISLKLYVCCGRAKCVCVSTEVQSVGEIISFLFDMEKVAKVPSTPLDLLTISGQFSERDPIVIVSDGFSEQLMCPDDNKVRSLLGVYSKLFLLCVKGQDDEALSDPNQALLEKALEANFHDNLIVIESIEDILNVAADNKLQNVFFNTQELKMNAVSSISPSTSYARDFKEDLRVDFKVSKSMVRIHAISSKKPFKLVDISDEQLNMRPASNSDCVVLNKLNGIIKEANLCDAMSNSLFIPSNSAAYTPSTSGPSIHFANYVNIVVNNTGNNKLFKKLKSEDNRGYNASIVIDCSSIAFSETNRVHSLITIFSILRNLSNMQLPCIDLWVASSQIIRIATGISSMDLWESNIVAALYQSLLSPRQNTCLLDCIRFACSTCNARSFDSVMMVFTNGVLCDESRAEIKSIVSGIEMTYLGIGIGLYLCGFEDLFPTMIWNSNPNQLSETLMNLSTVSMRGNPIAVPEKRIDDLILNGTFDKAYPDFIESICNIESDFQTILSSDKPVDEPDRSYKQYSILFIILYLCRGEKDESGKVVDEFITEETLRNGTEMKGRKCSPILKLGDKEINGKSIGKGFKIRYAFDYKSAINKLRSGRYRMTFITCSPGDGIMAKPCDDNVDQYADAFVSCVYEFNKRGGGVYWFLENYPFTYEADLYFKKFCGFEAVGDRNKTIKGGKVMERVESESPAAGHFSTIGGKATDLSNGCSLDFGVEHIFEGTTLCKLNENQFEKAGFRIFARESEGNASIVVKEKKGGSKEGRMIVDSAASKLFLEFTEDGTARWISNAAVWLCNTEEFEEERVKNPKLVSGIKMDGVNFSKEMPMEKRVIERFVGIL